MLSKFKKMRLLQKISYFAILLSATSIFVIVLTPERKPYVVIEATSEVLIYRVQRPEVAMVPLLEASIKSDFKDCPIISSSDFPVTGILKPSFNSVVTYRFTPDLIAMSFDGGDESAGTLLLADGNHCNLPARVVVNIVIKSKSMRPLPIAGPAEIGRELGSVTSKKVQLSKCNDFMYGGTVKVFGYARLWPYNGALYTSPGDEFVLPAGGRLTSDDNFNPRHKSSIAAPWFGIAEVSEKGFKISATTVSSDLRMYRPGATGEMERYALGLLTQIFYDPSMAILTVCLLTLSVIMQTLASLKSIFE